jgi:ribosomal protein L20
MPLNKEKILQLASHFRGRARNVIKIARHRVEKALQHAYVGRKLKKRTWRAVWITRINAGVREHGVSPTVASAAAVALCRRGKVCSMTPPVWLAEMSLAAQIRAVRTGRAASALR